MQKAHDAPRIEPRRPGLQVARTAQDSSGLTVKRQIPGTMADSDHRPAFFCTQRCGSAGIHPTDLYSSGITEMYEQSNASVNQLNGAAGQAKSVRTIDPTPPMNSVSLSHTPDCASEAGSRSEEEVHQLRSIVSELVAALDKTLKNDRGTAEECLKRAAAILDEADSPHPTAAPVQGGLAPWQVRRVTAYVDANLDKTIRNGDLAAVARLSPCHFNRVFRNSVGDPPHLYIIRRRIERAQGLMLSTDSSLSEIAAECGLADQAHFTRLFRRLAGDSPAAWRRARVSPRA
jgi:AraC family transcriptional regulator